MSSEARRGSGRIASIELIRVVAIVAVVLIHTQPLKYNQTDWAWYARSLLIQATRFAVPFFFMVSGYFWGKRVRKGKPVLECSWATSKRVLALFGIWSVIYLVVPDRISDFRRLGLAAVYLVPLERLQTADWGRWTFEGTSEHLWFLLSLVWAVGIATLFVRQGWTRWMMPFAFLLYVVGLVAGGYSDTTWGLPMGMNPRNGPFFSTIFFVIGWYLSDESLVVRPSTGWTLVGSGFALQWLEALRLHSAYGVNPSDHDYLFGTLAFGAGVMVLSLAYPTFGEGRRITRLSVFTLGVYVCHVLFIGLLENVIRIGGLEAFRRGNLGDACFSLAIIGISLTATWAMTRTPGLRRIVA